MIPKIIHYCWLSDDPIPEPYKSFIEEWQKIMPDYKIKKWDRSVINLDEHPFAKQAFEAKKYAFAADYIRVYALYHEGGIYLDSDVKVLKSFDPYLKYSYFSSIERQISNFHYKLLFGRFIDKKTGNRYKDRNMIYVGIQAAIIGSEPKIDYLRELLQFYKNQSFVENGIIEFKSIAPILHSKFAEKYGFTYFDKFQLLQNNMAIFSSSIFATKDCNVNDSTVAIHCLSGSWLKKKSFIKKNLLRFKMVRDLNLTINILKVKQTIDL